MKGKLSMITMNWRNHRTTILFVCIMVVIILLALLVSNRMIADINQHLPKVGALEQTFHDLNQHQ